MAWSSPRRLRSASASAPIEPVRVRAGASHQGVVARGGRGAPIFQRSWMAVSQHRCLRLAGNLGCSPVRCGRHWIDTDLDPTAYGTTREETIHSATTVHCAVDGTRCVIRFSRSVAPRPPHCRGDLGNCMRCWRRRTPRRQDHFRRRKWTRCPRRRGRTRQPGAARRRIDVPPRGSTPRSGARFVGVRDAAALTNAEAGRQLATRFRHVETMSSVAREKTHGSATVRTARPLQSARAERMMPNVPVTPRA